jgi:hypothetical protein
MQVGVADAAEGDVDLDVMGRRGAAIDLDRLKGFVARVGTVGLYKHGNVLDGSVGQPSSRSEPAFR